MEGFTWCLHRYVMHGFGWYLHKDHHQKGPGFLEKNDAYFLIFCHTKLVAHHAGCDV